MGKQNCHLILMQAKLNSELLPSIADVSSALKTAKKDTYQKIICTCNIETLDFYGYFYLREPGALPALGAIDFLGDHAKAFSDIIISRLAIQDFIKGKSDGVCALNRYVVEMDPELGWQEELFAWYDQEHLPGLASVPGCISATRCINLDHSPHSFAFYDLINPEVLGCEPWLNVRNTAWSDRVRPHFTNVKRTMFNIV